MKDEGRVDVELHAKGGPRLVVRGNVGLDEITSAPPKGWGVVWHYEERNTKGRVYWVYPLVRIGKCGA